MTHDEIIDKWIEAKFIDKSIYGMLRKVHYSDALALCRMVAAAEREACAKVADTIDLMPITEKGMSIDGQIAQAWQADNIAAAIRKRGEE